MVFAAKEKLDHVRGLIAKLDRSELGRLERDALFDQCFELLSSIRDLRRSLTISAAERPQ